MTTIGVSGWMFLLVLVHPGCPRQSPESRKMVVVVSNVSLLPTIMLYFERTLMVFLLLQNCVENCQDIKSM